MSVKDSGEADLDPLLKRLQDKYTKQRSEQLAGRRKRLEKDLNTQAVRNNTLPPSVELLSDETIHAFNDLEAVLESQPSTSKTLEQLRHIRSLVNQELRQSLSFLEDGYTSAFRTLIGETQLQRSREGQASFSPAASPLLNVSAGVGRGPPAHEGSQPTKIQGLPPPPLPEKSSFALPSDGAAPESSVDRAALLRQCPDAWRTTVKNTVVDEMSHQQTHQVTKLPRRLTVQEALSSVTGLFAESLASLLCCEVVRIYLYDENGNLHCCACFPSAAASVGDPMRATYTEIMLAKELHHSVCTKGIAINGSEPQFSMLSKRDVELIREETEANGWGSMRSCLIFPILFHDGVGRSGDQGDKRKSAGMIHAVNKVTTSTSQPGRFTADDEVLMSMAARTLGCMLTRYPVRFFTLRVGAAIREATHPNESAPTLDGHLPHLARDVVADASLIGMKALMSPQPVMILRAPISDVYQTRTHRSRNRKLGNLVTNDSALSSVEFNLTAVNELWESGMEDNVIMHQQYRTLNEQMMQTKLLMRNLLDGLAVTRTMRRAEDMARYVQNLEMFGRSENAEMLSDFIHNTLLSRSSTTAVTGSPVSPQPHRRSQEHLAAQSTSLGSTGRLRSPVSERGTLSTQATPLEQGSPTGAHAAVSPHAADVVEGTDAFLDSAAARALQWNLTRANTKAASHIHVDGPEGIRAYSSDPFTKREQVRFIEETQRERVAEQRRRLRQERHQIQLPHYLQGTAAQPTDQGPSHSDKKVGFAVSLPAQGKRAKTKTNSQFASTDYAAKRPYRL